MTNAAILASYQESPFELDEPPINGEAWINIGGLYRLEIQAITPGSEVMYGFQWLQATLSGDAILAGYALGGVWRAVAPSGTATPFVVVSFQSGTNTLTINANRLMVQALYLVKAVGPAAITAQIVQAASRIDVLIGDVRNGSI
jgi:hypothetical protein